MCKHSPAITPRVESETRLNTRSRFPCVRGGEGEAVTFEAKERENEIFRGESKSCDTFCYDLLLDSIIRETLTDTKSVCVLVFQNSQYLMST